MLAAASAARQSAQPEAPGSASDVFARPEGGGAVVARSQQEATNGAVKAGGSNDGCGGVAGGRGAGGDGTLEGLLSRLGLMHLREAFAAEDILDVSSLFSFSFSFATEEIRYVSCLFLCLLRCISLYLWRTCSLPLRSYHIISYHVISIKIYY